MKVFDKFFTKFAYKFDKGYPDMNNAQDVLLLESLLSSILGEEFNIINEATDAEEGIDDNWLKLAETLLDEDQIKK